MARVAALIVLGSSCTVPENGFVNRPDPTPPGVDNVETDTDTDADSDADTEVPQDTAGTVTWGGNYSGLIGANITYQERFNTDVIVYQCTGPFDVLVGATTPGITGSGICNTDGVPPYPTTFQMTLEGDVTSFPNATGNLVVVLDLFSFNAAWDGTFELEENEFEARGSNGLDGEPTINWLVNFTVER